ncbi:hypothetical protein HXW73_09010 [Halomonas sp. SH5A2]|uniref:hypothetical protein n=1 Tax=Halomonas sp. SH5A2 TaxID=2749040 RepID=UPI001640C9F8|nr:hypothetical protein [Halomonas sp. SH5A2]QNI03059.1 hypothetical protein HXW73_09010 [Halomonas sp. SH5A2]
MSTNDDSQRPNGSSETGSDKTDPRQELIKNLHAMSGRLKADPGVTSNSKAQAHLEKELSDEKDGRNEDRFLFIVALFVLFDIWTLKDSGTWALPIVLGIMQLFALLIIARRMGVEEIHLILNQLLPHLRLKAKERDGSTQNEPKKDEGEAQSESSPKSSTEPEDKQ